MINIKGRERTAIINSLRSGVVPRVGLHHIQVGRKNEVSEIIRDLDEIQNGTSTIRFVIGDYGSGKSFFLNLSSALAHQKNCIATQADVSMEKTLYSSEGKARALYSELVRNFSSKTKPEGGALQTIIEKWISAVVGVQSDVPKEEIHKKLSPIRQYVSGYDFSEIVSSYYQGYISGNEVLCENCLRWLRGEYATKTDAKKDLPVKTIIDDKNYYDYLKLLAKFIQMAGFGGLLINIDELAVLTRLQSNTRSKNYESVLKILNDCLQGTGAGFSFLIGGTPEFLEDKRRGLYSYGALESRLAKNPFSTETEQDFSGPVIRLQNLTQEELFLVFDNVRNVFASYEQKDHLIDDEGIKGFMSWIFDRMGAKSFLSPREAIRTYVNLLSQLERYPGKSWKEFLNKIELADGADNVDVESKKLEGFKL